jgi:predicted acetyltransferase
MRDSMVPDPGELSNASVSLSLRERSPEDPERGWVPEYHFTVVGQASGEPVGLLRLRVGTNESIERYAGHVGYAIAASHRGNRYAAHAVEAVLPLASRLSAGPLWITCDPDNLASRRTCEIVGATYVETVRIPESHPMYAEGVRYRARYRLTSSARVD